jgi:hypothetical protein
MGSQPPQHFQIGQGWGDNRLWRAIGTLGRGDRGVAVKGREPIGKLLQPLAINGARVESHGQQPLLIKLAHAHRHLDHGAVPQEVGPLGRAVDLDQIPVQLGCQASVEPQFLLAEMPPELQGAEVREAQVHGFFDLVGVGPGEQNPGDVGFHQVDPLRGVGVGLGL